MAKYICKRVLRAIFTLFIIITILFSLLRLMPEEGYFENYDKLSDIEIQVKLNSLGLNDPLPKQLTRFYSQLLRGDLGTSNVYRRGVSINEIIAEKIPISIRMGLISFVLALVMGLTLGIIMARSTRSFWKIGDKLGTVFIVIIQAVPSAVYHIVLQFAGSQGIINLHWLGIDWALELPMLFDASKPVSYILPILSLSIGSTAYYAMWLRRYMVDESNKDYVQLARAKGVPGGQISRKHVFRNAMIPLVQYIPGSILSTLMGSLYVESLYSIPGMGGLLVTAIKRQDNTLVQALVLIYAVISILGLLFGDILMAIVDPRISLSKKEGSR
ncbi:MAG: ABC transporter permease [Oscillospiraceae bacterium]|nr:ABC transporter permease [Oscillospiraceae bacterium]